MLGMIAWRLLSLIPVLLVVTFVVFLLTELVPGDAAESIAGGANATPEKIAEVRAELGLDRPVLERYFDWLGDAVQLDFGKSYASYNNVAAPDVAEEIAERLPVSISLALAGLFVAISSASRWASSPGCAPAAWSTGRASRAPASGSRSPTSCSASS